MSSKDTTFIVTCGECSLFGDIDDKSLFQLFWTVDDQLYIRCRQCDTIHKLLDLNTVEDEKLPEVEKHILDPNIMLDDDV